MDLNNLKTGTVEGTGAAINISCGFLPSLVKLYNIDGLVTCVWAPAMGAAYGFLAIDSGAGAVDFSLITSAGVSHFAGAIPPVAMTGTAVVAAGTTVVTGTSSVFLSQIAVGDVISIGGVQKIVADIVSDTVLHTTEAWPAVQTTVAMLNISGMNPGFTIGTNGDVNVSGETIIYEAHR